MLIRLVRRMPLQETLDTFKYFLSEVDKLKPSYVTLVRYSTMLDPGHRGTDHDIVGSYGSLFKNAKVVVNSGVTPEEGAALVAEGKADAVSFGLLFLAHPDLPYRIAHEKPLDNPVEFGQLYGSQLGPGGDMNLGYTNYPAATY